MRSVTTCSEPQSLDARHAKKATIKLKTTLLLHARRIQDAGQVPDLLTMVQNESDHALHAKMGTTCQSITILSPLALHQTRVNLEPSFCTQIPFMPLKGLNKSAAVA